MVNTSRVRYKKKKNRGSKTHAPAANPKMLPETLSIDGSKYIGRHPFACGNSVPVYEVDTVHSLNQLIGYAKFNNQSYGNVYYRGECKLHDSLKPSLYRKGKKAEGLSSRLNTVIKRFLEDPHMVRELKIDKKDIDNQRYKIEGMLQHYGIPTRFIDVVDNHWVALWMGLYKAKKFKQRNEYFHYIQRSVPVVDIVRGEKSPDDALYQYVLLMAVPFSENRSFSGLQTSEDYIEVDLRQALPSIFLRPHAQHGLVLKRKVHGQDVGRSSDDYDMASTVIGIIKVRIDNVREWIGNGALLTQENLFPPPGYDYGYDLLLMRADLFEGSEYPIVRYV